MRSAFSCGDRPIGEGEAAEEFQIDELGERGIRPGERIQRVADVGQLRSISDVLDDVGAERGDLELAAALAPWRESFCLASRRSSA